MEDKVERAVDRLLGEQTDPRLLQFRRLATWTRTLHLRFERIVEALALRPELLDVVEDGAQVPGRMIEGVLLELDSELADLARLIEQRRVSKGSH